jgi:phage tail sheath protein FI
MPITPTYPGVYIEELPSGVRTITGVATSVTAFVGRARRGPTDKATPIHSFGEYERLFGKLWEESPMGYAVYHYFLNGGTDAVIVRVHNGDASTTATLTIRNEDDDANIILVAASPGSWGSRLRARVDYTTKDISDTTLFNLSIKDIATGVIETHRNLSTVVSSPRYMTKVLLEDSDLVRVETFGTVRPVETPDPDSGAKSPFEDSTDGSALSNAVVASNVNDGLALAGTEISGSATEPKTGLHALDAVDIVNLLVIPPYIADSNGDYLNGDISSTVRSDALNYAKGRRAIFIVDPLSTWNKKEDPLDSSGGVDSASFGLSRDANAAIYFPRIKAPDPQEEGRLKTFTPSGVIAGLIARTDAQRGVWKAPAGTDAALAGVPDLALRLTDPENGELNPQGINCLRIFKGIGRVAWGARTMRGSDILADQWKYLPVRRTALYIEESLYRGTQWVVFEPNDERLWAQIRLNVGAFMHNMFRQGAFQGTSQKDAYLVKCDSETTTQNDINRGVVNILVGFAPLKPAEFVIIQIQQLAGQVES